MAEKRHAGTHRAGMGVGGGAEGGGTTAEYFCVGLELGMYLQPDDRFKVHFSNLVLLMFLVVIRVFHGCYALSEPVISQDVFRGDSGVDQRVS